LRDDGRITVLNKGHDINDPTLMSSSEGVAWVPDKNSPAKLKVRFFWPFTGDYWIMELDKNYKYVLIGEPKLRYLWILSRDSKLDEKTYNMLLSKAIANGYDVKPIIKIDQDCK
jgi:lipocalin